MDATNNYWGTTVESVIQDKIYDRSDYSAYGIVYYSPWLTQPAPPIPELATLFLISAGIVIMVARTFFKI